MTADWRAPDVQPVQIDLDEIRHALQTNEEFFIQFFLGEELSLPVPEFHKEILHEMSSAEVRRSVYAVPRDHAKTTIAKLAVCRFFLFHQRIRFIVYVSNTAAVAIAACKDIINFLETDNCVAVFGAAEFMTRQEGMGYYEFKLNGKHCILKALGAGQQIRGMNIDNQRPQLAVVDDLEDNDNTATPDLRKKMKRWVYGPFLKALDKLWNKVIWLGNMISNQCLLKSLCDDPGWHSMHYGAIRSNGEPLWPDAFPLAKLAAEYAEYQRQGMAATWFAEMMNQPVPDGMGLIKSDEINYAPAISPNEFKFGFITVDPAIGKKNNNDNTGVAVHALVRGKWQVVDYFCGKVGPIELLRLVLALAYKWGVRVIGFESVQYQAALKPFMEYYLLTNGVTEHFYIVELMAAGHKTARLMTWAAMLKNKEYAICEGDMLITQQLLEYDPSKDENDDDLIDSCAYGTQMIARFLNIIMEERKMLSDARVQTSVEICGV